MLILGSQDPNERQQTCLAYLSVEMEGQIWEKAIAACMSCEELFGLKFSDRF
jgi:hypothetical protein